MEGLHGEEARRKSLEGHYKQHQDEREEKEAKTKAKAKAAREKAVRRTSESRRGSKSERSESDASLDREIARAARCDHHHTRSPLRSRAWATCPRARQ